MTRKKAQILDLVALIASADRAPSAADNAEKKLAQLADPACINLLLPLLVGQYPPWGAADSVIRILHSLKASDKACRYLVGKLKDRNWRTRAAAANVLESFHQIRVVPALVGACNDRNVEVRIGAMHSLWVCSLGRPKLENTVFDVCRRGIRHPSHGVRGAAYECISHMTGARCDELLALAAKDRHRQIRQMSTWWLQERKQRGGT